ncbi:hypothetical protein BHYA_0129g00270 [Botrytis hyacinthi]|uniref:Uncharacterized protein n=1 Tax=Botrytis hyacinthi TaxID=278943 RepID=A0A4Z1GHC7_9HELO|nr:hypothetical protein BHYA_0129g00270 [Botrytis hyacinthi]
MSTSTKIQPSSSPQSTKIADQPSYSASPEPHKSTYRILRDAGFRGMNDFMFSHGLKLHNDEDLAQAKEMIQRMKEEDLMGEDLRRLEFRAAKGEEDVKDERGTESSEEEDGVLELIRVLEVVSDEEEEDGTVEPVGALEVVGDEEVFSNEEEEEEEGGIEESIGFADVVSSNEVDDRFQVSGVEIVEELDRVSSREEESDKSVDVGMVDDDNAGEDFGYEDLSGGDDGYEDFEDDFDDDSFYDD